MERYEVSYNKYGGCAYSKSFATKEEAETFIDDLPEDYEAEILDTEDEWYEARRRDVEEYEKMMFDLAHGGSGWYD